jgi:hypothetical protein
MRRSVSKWVPIAGGFLSAWYAFNTWASWSMENCTMGDTDGYVGGLIFALPGALAALVVLVRSAASRWLLVSSLFAAVPPGLLLGVVVPWFASATIEGHHLCGSEYDSYLPYSAALRYLPALHMTLCVALIGVCLVQFLRAMVWRAGAAITQGEAEHP